MPWSRWGGGVRHRRCPDHDGGGIRHRRCPGHDGGGGVRHRRCPGHDGGGVVIEDALVMMGGGSS